MTEKQKRFCDEYLIDCNATRAYKAVYQNVKSDETAKSAASRLLTNVNVKKYIDDRMEELHNEKTADAQEVIEYLTSVLRGESTAQEIVVEGTGDGCSNGSFFGNNGKRRRGDSQINCMGRRRRSDIVKRTDR